jgi:hypothetical protein
MTKVGISPDTPRRECFDVSKTVATSKLILCLNKSQGLPVTCKKEEESIVWIIQRSLSRIKLERCGKKLS